MAIEGILKGVHSKIESFDFVVDAPAKNNRLIVVHAHARLRNALELK